MALELVESAEAMPIGLVAQAQADLVLAVARARVLLDQVSMAALA
jgi:hypothetical protein